MDFPDNLLEIGLILHWVSGELWRGGGLVQTDVNTTGPAELASQERS